jgi:hypothetical protein
MMAARIRCLAAGRQPGRPEWADCDETELLKPVSDLLHRGSAPGLSGSLARIDKSIPNRCRVGVEVGIRKMLAC